MRGMRILGACMAFAMYEYNAIAPGAGGTPDIAFTMLTQGDSITDLQSYTTGSFTVAAGDVIACYDHQFLTTGNAVQPTITLPGGDTMTVVPNAFGPTAQQKRQFLFLAKVVTGGTGTASIDAGAGKVQSEGIWGFWKVDNAYTTGGVLNAIVNDQTKGFASLANNTLDHRSTQPVYNAKNVIMHLLTVGSNQRTITQTDGTTTLFTQSSQSALTSTLGVFYKKGSVLDLTVGWDGVAVSVLPGCVEWRHADAAAPNLLTDPVVTNVNNGGGLSTTATGVAVTNGDTVYFIVATNRATLTADPTITDTLGNLTWSQISATSYNTIAAPTMRLMVYKATATSTTSGNIIATFGSSQTKTAVTALPVTGAGAGSVQAPVTAVSDSGANPTVTLASFADPLNGTLFILSSVGGATAIGDETGTGMQRLSDIVTTSNQHISIYWQHSQNTAPAVTLAAAAYAAAGVEVDTT